AAPTCDFETVKGRRQSTRRSASPWKRSAADWWPTMCRPLKAAWAARTARERERRSADRGRRPAGSGRQYGLRPRALHRLLCDCRLHEDEENGWWRREGRQEPRRAHLASPVRIPHAVG